MADSLPLTEFLDLPRMQQLQDRFAAIAGVRVSIRDAQGRLVTQPSGPADAGRLAASAGQAVPAACPIELDGRRLGEVVLEAGSPPQPAALDFLALLANTIGRLCFQAFQLRWQVEELSTIYRLANELVVRDDLPRLLDLITRSAVETMKVKAASLRLLDADRGELVVKSVCGLSPKYLSKGPVLLEASQIDRAALAGEPVYIADLADDRRVLYPAEMKHEGLVSGLVVGLVYRDRPVGVIHLYTGRRHAFSPFEVSLVRAVANQAATAIVNAELQIGSRQAELTRRQLELARDVQQRMLPTNPPRLAGIDLAGLYTPCFDLGGDFYDFIELPDGRLGIVIADVVGKGVAASLMMAAVRSSLRAYAFQHRDIAELIRQVNRAMCRDTLPSEFVTMFYGELDPASLRLRYCNAGHNPPILLRRSAGEPRPVEDFPAACPAGRFAELAVGGTIVGAFEDANYTVADVRLSRGDLLLLYTDGLVDSVNFSAERFDTSRVRQAMLAFVDQPAANILGHLRWEIHKFTGLAPRVDDMAMVALKVL